MKIYLIFFLVIFFISARAQNKNTSYAPIDSRAKHIEAPNAELLAQKLTSFCKTDREKVRSIFRWITEKIVYDIKGYHNPKGVYDSLWDAAEAEKAADVEGSYHEKVVNKVLKERKAVCDGYSRLFKTLCDYANVKCVIISGFARWSSDSIGVFTKRGHAWNAVFIDNSWRLIDATWASGYSDANVTVFTKRFNDFYFFTDPIQFFNDHYPDDKNWSLLPSTPSLSQFYNFPFYHPAFYKNKITSLYPTSGFIEVKRSDKSVTIQLETSGPKKYFYIAEYPRLSDTAHFPDYIIEKTKLFSTYKVENSKAEKIDVYLNGDLILTYGLKWIK